jgi:hypothetical protein
MSDYACHYGCYLGSRCHGASREEVIEYLEENEIKHSPTATDAELNRILEGLADVDYTGPDHVFSAVVRYRK